MRSLPDFERSAMKSVLLLLPIASLLALAACSRQPHEAAPSSTTASASAVATPASDPSLPSASVVANAPGTPVEPAASAPAGLPMSSSSPAMTPVPKAP